MNLTLVPINAERTRISGLHEVMIQKQATNIALGEAAGVCNKSVENARLGGVIMLSTAENIIEALNTKVFKYSKRGSKGLRT